MMTMPRREIATRDLAVMPPAEREREWRKAKECFDKALVEKTETDRIYVAAANKLNMLDRLAKKEIQRAAITSRAAARSLIMAAKIAAR